MPQRPGNHGRFIPRNRRMLRRLYWKEQKTLTEIALLFDVTHKSVARVFDQRDIPRRPRRSKECKPIRGCIECGKPCFKVYHAGNGAWYGRRCKFHWDKHRAFLAKEEFKRPEVAARKRREHHRWYYYGPITLKGEQSWLSKGRSIMRTLKRELRKPNRGVLSSPKAASKLVRSLRV